LNVPRALRRGYRSQHRGTNRGTESRLAQLRLRAKLPGAPTTSPGARARVFSLTPGRYAWWNLAPGQRHENDRRHYCPFSLLRRRVGATTVRSSAARSRGRPCAQLRPGAEGLRPAGRRVDGRPNEREVRFKGPHVRADARRHGLLRVRRQRKIPTRFRGSLVRAGSRPAYRSRRQPLGHGRGRPCRPEAQPTRRRFAHARDEGRSR